MKRNISACKYKVNTLFQIAVVALELQPKVSFAKETEPVFPTEAKNIFR